MDQRRPVVLVVEDDPAVRDAVAAVLETDYESVLTDDGPAGLDAFQRLSVDAVLLDLRMPGMSGLDVLRQMKAIAPRVEVILLTAVDDIPTVVEGMKAGAFDYITKPFHIDGLLVAVERAVRQRSIGGEVFLVTDEIGLLTAVHVLVERTVASAISLSAGAALKGLPGRRSRLLVLESPAQTTATVDLMTSLQARYSGCPFVVASKPYRLGEVLERIAVAIGPVNGRAVATPHLRPAIIAVAEHVSQHYREKLLAQDLARAVRVSPEQLGQVFRESLGITPKDFVTRFRISAACRLLIDGDCKLEHIAELTGFQDASHLSRVFTRELGIRPGEYRRRVEIAA